MTGTTIAAIVAMLYFVPRKCRTREDDPANNVLAGIEHFRSHDAYVLLGDPGAGKSRLFKDEAQKTENGLYITARDFIDFDRTEWHGKTLFIDGLDEIRAGRHDPQTPLGAIRSKLDRLGRPNFRLSCRAADWHGSSDAESLQACAPSGKITALYLEPLDREKIQEILDNDDRITNVETFLENAGRFGLDGLLDNPQTLDMLIEAVADESWPTSKLQVYELACKKLAVDPKRSHPNPLYTLPQLLDAAGWLSVVQLLSNAPDIHRGYTQGAGIGLSNLELDNVEACKAVLGTRLFTSVGNDAYTYIHRSVAEFLGARYISERLKLGLPFNRVLAIATGFDGGMIAALRGLMAWLGAHNPEACDRLIEMDPLGMVLYGDAQLFSVVTKQRLLEALQTQGRRAGPLDYGWSTHAFAALATPDMVPHLQSWLTSHERDKSHQEVIYCILMGLYRTTLTVPGLADTLFAITLDPTYMDTVRVRALKAYLHQYPDQHASLLALAENIKHGKVKDDDFDLLGTLLDASFPEVIQPDRIFQYLLPKKDERHSNEYDSFWDYFLPQRITDGDLPQLLDALASVEWIYPRKHSTDWHASRMAENLLIRGLLAHGEHIQRERLYRWLSIGVGEHGYSYLEEKVQQEIRAWLNTHSECYLNLLEIGVHGITETENLRLKIHEIFSRCYHAKPPVNLRDWWLAQSLIANTRELREECFRHAFWAAIENWEDDSSLEVFEGFVERHPFFLSVYQQINHCDISEIDWRLEHSARTKEFAKKRAADLQAKMDYFRQHQAIIADGSAYPQTYYHLASAWFDHYSSANGKSGDERLTDFLNHDEELISAAKSGLLKMLERKDLPSVDEIFDLAFKERQHYIRLPFLICMEKRYQENPVMLVALDDALAERAFAFWYTYGAGKEPTWVKVLTLLRPNLTAKTFVNYARAMLAGKKQHITGVYALARDPDYEVIAQIVAMQLLETYPVRSAKDQLNTLEYLFKAAIAYSDKQKLLALVHKRLALKGLDIAQRVYLIATGFVLAPEEFIPLVRNQVAGNVTRINHFSAFLYSGWNKETSYPLPPASMGLLIEILGPRCTPAWPSEAHWVSRADNERDYVRALLNKLGGMPDETSGHVLDRLLTVPQLTTWHEAIRQAWQTQQVSRREATFKHPDIHQVVDVLRNRKPANVADLAALTEDFLHKLAIEMHASDTDSYKHFWNVDGYNKPTSPRPENSCRDYLASRLKVLFAPFDVSVLPETREAETKRADIRIAYRSDGNAFHLPIEIKLDNSPDLWRAIREQLIPLYTNAPETGGRGVLLVIWFNDPERGVASPPTGTKPKTASELAARLQATLSPNESKLIEVFVLDVSRH